MNPTPTTSAKLSLITFTNARSFQQAAIEPHPGLNVIVGSSDAGKSNVVRNLMSLTYNDSMRELARVGAADCDVGVEFTDGIGVRLSKAEAQARKTKAENSYTLSTTVGQAVAGKTFSSVGSSVPDEVAKALALGDIDIAGEQFTIHIATQRGKAFLVDESHSLIAKVIGAVSGMDTVYRAVTLAGEKKNQTASDETALRTQFEQDKATYQRERDSSNLVEARARIDDAAASQTDIDRLIGQVTELRHAIEEFELDINGHRELHESVGHFETALTEAVALFDGQLTEAWNARHNLHADIDEFENALGGLVFENKAIDEAQETIDGINDELTAYLKTNPACPTCGAPLTNTTKGKNHAAH